MNKEDLKNKIETFYIKSLNVDNPDFLIALDAIKSIIGINLDQVKISLLDWFSDSLKGIKINEYKMNNFKNIPGAISFYSLESALLDNNKKKSYESIFYLSKVSEGTQVFEFLLEFSLKYTEDCFKYIWHIMRLERLFNGKYRIESLNRCVDLLMIADYIDCCPSERNSALEWDNCFNSKTDNVLLYYIVYNSELTRSDTIRRLISGKLEISSMQDCSSDDINVKEEQLIEGKLWINRYFDNLKIKDISLSQIILLDQIRSCLLFEKQYVDIKLFWNYLNKNLCN
ncbi:MAG: hypothetical protein CMG66_00640 [Candidatus Marinimicrobia bacterium]|nr:hypothetical protein [Candidatus Neomarinimicrobiota bacterium]|tara:strand:- start:19933 stop:20787 length:855 start_codon:yes stop_codon:yes gene_type:complete